MGYLLLIIAVAFGAGGFYGGYEWEAGKVARAEKAQAEAQAKVDAQARAIEQEAQNKIIDMTAAFDAGEAKAKVVTRTVYAKGQQYVATNAVFSNPVCVVPADGMSIVNGARAGVRTASAAAGGAAAMPAAGSDPGRTDLDAVPATPAGHGTVGGVHPKPRPIDRSGQVPG